MNNKNLFIIILFFLTSIYYLPILKSPLAPYDEAVILVGAERVLQGQIPFKDFFSVYPPGQITSLAALFKVFGTSVTIERVYDIIIKSFLSLFVFLIIRRLSSNIAALAGWAMSLIWVGYSSFPAYPMYPALLFTYISVYLLLFHIERDKNYYVILSALFIVCSILFRHDLGGYAAFGITMVLMVRKIIGVQSWTPVISYIASGIIAGLPFLIYIYHNSALAFMINDLILWPANVFPKYQGLPYPSLSRWNLPFYMFPLVLATGVIASLILIKTNKDNKPAYGMLIISLIGIIFINQVRVRSDMIHLLPVALTGILLAPILFYRLSKGLSLSIWHTRLVGVLFIIVFGVTLSQQINRQIGTFPEGYAIKAVDSDIDRVRYINISSDLKSTVAYIKNTTAKNEYIYVGVKNHDQFVFNDAIIYFLAERSSATKYHEFNPGHTNTLPIQKEMVNELQDKPVRLVVLVSRFRYEPNLSSVDSEIGLLDDYISRHFELIKTYGIYEIWMKT